MKKLKLELQQMSGAELLSKDQLKEIIGGQQQVSDGSCPEGSFWCTCTNGSGSVGFCASSVQECWDAC